MMIIKLDDIPVGSTEDLARVRYATDVPKVLKHNPQMFYDGTVTRVAVDVYQWKVDVSVPLSINIRKTYKPTLGKTATFLADNLAECHRQGIEITSIEYTCAYSSNAPLPKYTWEPDYQSVAGESAIWMTVPLKPGSLKLRDLMYLVGPTTEVSDYLIDIWVVRKLVEDGIVVSSIVQPKKFKMNFVSWNQLEWLLPIVVITGMPARGLVVPGATVLLEGSAILARHPNVSAYPPIIKGIDLV
mgnify:CR=1 FL=1